MGKNPLTKVFIFYQQNLIVRLGLRNNFFVRYARIFFNDPSYLKAIFSQFTNNISVETLVGK